MSRKPGLPKIQKTQKLQMPTQTPEKRKPFASTLKTMFLGVLVGVLGITIVLAAHPRQTFAATSDTINFQAKLMTASGAIAADGNYNVEFNLYNQLSGGTSLWGEDYLNSASNGVHVVNGYLTVNLGAVNPFPSTINWNQNLWIGMTVRGTDPSCSFATCNPTDAEMTPRLKLTAVPFAMSAGNLANVNGTVQSSLVFQGGTVGNQIFQLPDQGAAGTYNILTSANAGSFVQLQTGTPTAQTGNLSISGTGMVGVLQAGQGNILIPNASNVGLTVQGASSQSADLVQFKASNGTSIYSGFDNTGNLYFKDQTSGFVDKIEVQGNSLSQSNVLYLPNKGGTICTSTGSCIGTGGTGDVFKNGQAGPLVIGTTDTSPATDLTFITDNKQQVVITGGGNVGIGLSTANPSQLLSVGGTAGYFTVNGSGNIATTGTLQAGTSSQFSVTNAGVVTAVLATALPSAVPVCQNTNGQLSGCSTTGSGAAFVQGGNKFGATAVLGAEDNFGLNIQTNATTRIAIDNVGNTTFSGNVGIGTTGIPSQLLSVGTGTGVFTVDSSGNIVTSGAFDQSSSTGTFKTGQGANSLNGNTTVVSGKSFTVAAGATSLTGLSAGSSTVLGASTGAASNVGVSIAAVASQTANLFQLQNSSGDVLARNTANGQLILGTIGTVTGSSVAGSIGFGDGTTDGFTGTLSLASPITANQVYSLPTIGGTICIESSTTCGFALSTDLGNAVQKVPTSNMPGNAGANIIAPTAAGIIGLTINATTNSGTPATAAIINQTQSAIGLQINNSGNNSALNIVQSTTLAANNAAIYVNDTSGTAADVLLDLRAGGASKFSVNAGGNVAASGTYNTNTFNGHTLTFGDSTQAATITSGTGQALNFTGNGTSIIQTTAGSLGLLGTASAGLFTTDSSTGATGAVSIGTGNATTTGGTGAVVIITGDASSGTAGSILIDNGTSSTGSAAINIGTTNANTINIGRTAATTVISGTLQNANSSPTFQVSTTGNVTAVLGAQTTNGALVCQNTTTDMLSACDSTYKLPTAGSFILNTTTQQSTSNFNISGTGIANVLQVAANSGSFDTAAAGKLNIGLASGGNATEIDLNQNSVVTTGKNFTVAAGTSSFTGASTGTTAAVSVTPGNVNSASLAVTGASGQATNIATIKATSGTGLTVDQNGNIVESGTYNTNTLTSSQLAFGASSAATVQAANNQNLTVQSQGTGGLTLQSGNGAISLGTSTILAANGALNVASGGNGALTLQTANQTASSANSATITIGSGNASGTTSNSGNVAIDTGTATGTTGMINIGTTNASGVTIGRATTTTVIAGTLQNAASSPTFAVSNTGNVSAVLGAQTTNGALVCQNTSTHVLSACDSTYKVPTASNFILNQNTQQTSANFNIDGTGIANVLQGNQLKGGSSQQFTVDSSGNVLTSGTYNTNTFTSTALTFAGANPVISASISNTNLSVNANGTGTLSLNTSGAGTVNVGTVNSTTVALGNTSANFSAESGTGTTSLFNGNTNHSVQLATGNAVQSVTIGSLGSTSTLSLQGGTGANAVIISAGSGSTPGTITVGNITTTGTQAINIGTNATASSTTNVLIGSTIGGTTTLQSAGGVKVTTLGSVSATTVSLCYDTSTKQLVTCDSGSGGKPFIQGGNSFGATAVLGTNDNNSLTLETNNVTRFTIDTSGNGTLTGALTANKGVISGASAGSGSTLTNNGSTVNATLTLGNLSSGPIGTAAATVDVYTAIAVPETSTGQTLTIPTPTASTNYGRVLYLVNTGSAAFGLLGSTLNPGAAATLIWSNTNGGPAWTYAGADGSGILNQKAVSQSANFRISGSGQADGGFMAPSFDTASGTGLNLGTSNATGITIGGSGAVFNTTVSANLIVGSGNAGSATAFTIQNSTTQLLVADTSAQVIKIGTTSTLQQTNDSLVAQNTEIQGKIFIGTNSGSISTASAGGPLRYSGSARNSVTATLVPEYAGAVMSPTGSGANVGTMTSDFCANDGTTTPSATYVNPTVCTVSGQYHNYYSWTNGYQAAAQDYDIFTRWQVPSNYDATGNTSPALTFYGWKTNNSNDALTLTIRNGATSCGTITITSTAAWSLGNLASAACGTITPGSTVLTFDVHMSSALGDYVRAGEIGITYYTVF